MAKIRVSTELAAPPDVVWADISDVGSHVEWMHDAETIRFTSDAVAGVGVTFDCDTRVGPLRLTDRMEITEWSDEKVMGVRHVGLVTGTGHFTLTPVGEDRTSFAWEESLTFSWWMGGPVGAIAGGWILKLGWRRNLRNLAARFA